MMRYKVIIEYCGTHLAGWQKQPYAMSVQEVVETAIFNFTRQSISLFCAGRTDAGVHAMAQVAHFDLENSTMSDISIMNAINFHVRPYQISVLDIERVEPEWHARFEAKQKTYVYKILNRRARPTLDMGKVLHIGPKLNISAMDLAKDKFVGKFDFSSFRSSECQAKSPIRTIDSCQINQYDHLIEIEFKARSFLHHQVRNMVGALIAVGRGRNIDISAIIDARDRCLAPATAPAHGLYLKEIRY